MVIKESWEIEREKRIEQAAEILVDEIWPIREKLKNACLLLQDIMEEYFEKYDQGKEGDRMGIWWEFPRNARYVSMVGDYVHQAEAALAILDGVNARKALENVEGANPTKS